MKCLYCFKSAKVDDRGLCGDCKDCPESVWRRLLGQLALGA